MKKTLLSLLVLLTLLIGTQLPAAAGAAGARNYLSATAGGSVEWAEDTSGDAVIGTVGAGQTIEFAGYYAVSTPAVRLTAKPENGFSFRGWYTRWNSTDPQLVSTSAAYTWTLPAESGETLTAVFSNNSGSCTVTFDMDGHYGAVPAQTVASGTRASRPSSPASDANASDYDSTGLHFHGWYNKPISEISSYTEFCYTPDNGGCIFDFNTPITGDITAYAAYWGVLTIKVYDVTHALTYGCGSFDFRNYNRATASKNVNNVQDTAFYGMPEFLTANPAEGYAFAGWSTSTSKDDIISRDADFAYMFKGRATLYALFEDNTLGLCLGATANGAYTARNGEGHTYGDETVTGSMNISISRGDTLSLKAIPDNGYAFLGWYEGVVGSSYFVEDHTEKLISADAEYSFTVKEYVALQAVFGKVYSVTYDANGGTGTMAGAQVKAGEKLTLPANGFTAPAGKEFDAWDAGSPGEQIDIAADTVIKAIWKDQQAEPVETVYLVTYDAGGGTGAMPGMQVKAGEKLTLPANGFTAPAGKEFDVWDAGSPGEQIDIAADTVIKAIWKDQQAEPVETVYLVTYDANGGTGTMAGMQVKAGEKLTLPENGFTAPAGKEFDAWDAGRPGEQIDITADTMIRAIWKDQKTEPVVISYGFTAGDGAVWTKGGTAPLEFTVKGSPDDSNTFSRFTGIEIDGAAVAGSHYTAAAGSVKISLKAAYLESLPVGSHTLKAVFADGSAAAAFSVKDREVPVDPEPVTPEYVFSFTKVWQGEAQKSIDWTLYDRNGSVVQKTFSKEIISKTEWYYEAGFSADEGYYLVENVPAGYRVSYRNTGAHAGETDRCYNGGTIINAKIPKTGDNARPVLWLCAVLLGLSVLAAAEITGRRRKKASSGRTE